MRGARRAGCRPPSRGSGPGRAAGPGPGGVPAAFATSPGTGRASGISPARRRASRSAGTPANSPATVAAAAARRAVSPTRPGKRSTNASPTIIEMGPAAPRPKAIAGPARRAAGEAIRSAAATSSCAATRPATAPATTQRTAPRTWIRDPARNRDGTTTAPSSHAGRSRISRRSGDANASASPRQSIVRATETPSCSAVPMPRSDIPRSSVHSQFRRISRPSRRAVRAPSAAPSTGPVPTGGRMAPGPPAKTSTPMARSGTTSCPRARSAASSVAGPRAPSRSTAHWTALRVVPARAAPLARARRSRSRSSGTAAAAEGAHRNAPHARAAAPAPVTRPTSPPATSRPAGMRRVPLVPYSSPTSIAIQPTATTAIGSKAPRSRPLRAPSADGPTTNPSTTHSDPEGSPRPRSPRPPMRNPPR